MLLVNAAITDDKLTLTRGTELQWIILKGPSLTQIRMRIELCRNQKVQANIQRDLHQLNRKLIITSGT